MARKMWSGAGLAIGVLALLLITLPSSLAHATTPTYTTNYVWDANRRLVLKIEADPGTGVRAATRFVYDIDGQLIETDKGTTTQPNGSDFTPLETTTVLYDAVGNKTQQMVWNGNTAPSASAPALSISEYSYDADDRALCTAVRMNPAGYGYGGATAQNACASLTGGGAADRITQLTYDAAGQKTVETRALGTPQQQAYATYSYTLSGKQASVKDANGNLTSYTYDSFDRPYQTLFPVTTLNAGASDPNNYEAVLAYDANDNVLQRRKRDGAVIAYVYDNLNREIVKHWPTGNGALDVYTGYDLAGEKLSATYGSPTGAGVVYAYDLAGRTLSETTGGRTMTYAYDAANNRTQVTWPDGFYATYVYDAMDHVTAIEENGATSGIGLLASYSYDGLGRRTGVSRGNGSTTTYTFDNADRLNTLAHVMPAGAGTGYNQTFGAFAYNPANQILSRPSSNPLYDFQGFTPGTINKAADGLNRDATIAAIGTGPCAASGAGYDCNGNVTNDGQRTFAYDTENRLINAVSGSTTVALSYDPLGRLQQQATTQTGSSSTTTQFLYDGDKLSAEYDGSGNLLRRYVHDTGVDQPLVWYEGPTGTTDRRWLYADNQGSIIAQANAAGAVTQTYAYGPYGEPQAWGGSRFAYTGQIQLPEAMLYHYKARVYDPIAGRFLQTDPVGYKDDVDLYAYVGDDPTNKTDPTGKLGLEFSVEAWVAIGNSGRYDSESIGVSVSRNGLIQVGRVGVESTQPVGDKNLGAAASAGPGVFRGSLSDTANTNRTAVSAVGPVTVSNSYSQQGNKVSAPVTTSVPSRKAGGGGGAGHAVFNTSHTATNVASGNPIEAVKTAIVNFLTPMLPNLHP